MPWLTTTAYCELVVPRLLGHSWRVHSPAVSDTPVTGASGITIPLSVSGRFRRAVTRTPAAAVPSALNRRNLTGVRARVMVQMPP